MCFLYFLRLHNVLRLRALLLPHVLLRVLQCPKGLFRLLYWLVKSRYSYACGVIIGYFAILCYLERNIVIIMRSATTVHVTTKGFVCRRQVLDYTGIVVIIHTRRKLVKRRTEIIKVIKLTKATYEFKPDVIQTTVTVLSHDKFGL